jgi:flavorubredoxin
MTETRVDEIAEHIYRINTPIEVPGGAFSFNQYLIADDQPLLFHSGPRRLFPSVREAVAQVLPLDRLRFIGFSHYESDECGALNAFLAIAPRAEPVCGMINAMINGDTFDRPPQILADGEELALGRHRVRWFDTPHLPHAWECGYLFEAQTRTLLCGDLFTQPGDGAKPLVASTQILDESEAFRKSLDYYSHTTQVRPMLTRLAETEPTTLACMHGSAWQGNGATLLGALADALSSQ